MMFRRILGCALAALILSGCVPTWTGSAMQEDIAQLKRDQAALNENLGTKQAEFAEMVEQARADVASVQKVLKEATELFQRNDADFGMEVESTRMELQRLRGQVEKMRFDFTRLQQDLQLFKEDVDLRFAEGGGAQMPTKAKELLKFGEDKFNSKDYRLARRAFQTYASKFPKDRNVAKALFMAGETLFMDGQWVSAVYEYQKTLQAKNPGKLTGDATFRIGQCFAKLGKCKQAAIFFESVTQDHGSSKFASQARKELKRAKSGNCK